IENEVNVKDYINNSIYEKALDSLINEDPDNTYLKDLKQYHEGALYAGSSALDDCCEEVDDCCNETADCCG
ncbi:MAG: hypothetical protein J6U67_06865, partial [Lachnospiraceae bacterium]|nr:hypothetical protein [Lachnospiraceae bacterium]